MSELLSAHALVPARAHAHAALQEQGDAVRRIHPHRGAGALPTAALPVAEFLTVELAATRLSTSPDALRARCRRRAHREGKEVVARLGAGVVAYKFGASWRLRFGG